MAGLGVAFLMVVACESGATPAGSSAPASERTSTPLPSATVSQDAIRSTAASAYLAAATASNADQQAIVDRYGKLTALAPSKEYCARLADNRGSLARAVNGIVYPVGAQQPAIQLMAALTAEEAHLKSCASARNMTEWNLYWDKAFEQRQVGRTHANQLRLVLGLPAVD